MFARLRSEFIYARGLLRAVSRTNAVGATPSKTLGDHLEAWARQFGDRPALGDETRTLTYRQFDARANQYARWARARGLSKGDVIALMMQNSPEYLAIWFGFARVGVITALINTNLTGPSLAHGLTIAKAKAIVVEASLLSALATSGSHLGDNMSVHVHELGSELTEELAAFADTPLGAHERPEMKLGDAALFVYTSGTTGLPKAARITHSRVLRAMYGFCAASRSRARDRIYIPLPMYHANGGFLGPGAVLPVGGFAFIRKRFSASEFWVDVIRERCTMFVYIGELCRYLLNAPPSRDDTRHSVRICLGNGLRPDIFTAFQRRFALPSILELYASTEGNAVMMNLDSHPGAVGRVPFWAASRFPMKIIAFETETNTHPRNAEGRCIECAVDEIGELIAEIRDDPKLPAARFDGYVDPAATQAKILRDAFKPGDAWFRAGDLMRRDALGYFYFVDRIGDTFRWKGENVSTTEVAEAIAVFPGVREVTVYGVSLPGHDGRAGMAALVVDSVSSFDLDAFHAHVAKNLASYARPLFLRFKSDLEVTSTFKQKKADLIEQGFDPDAILEPLYREDRAANAYRRVDADFIAALASGQVSF